MKHLCEQRGWTSLGRCHVVYTGLACLLMAVSVAGAQSVDSPFTLNERASTNRLDLFRTASEMIKTHGLFLDDKHRVKLYEDDGWIIISLQTKQRAPGGPHDYGTQDAGGDEATIRYEQEYDLMRIGSEVLASAPPNYVKNPGRRYRIMIEGLAVAPLYKTNFEVDAANALDAVATEFHKLSGVAKGLEVPAIEFGGLLAMRALNESGFLPARIPLTILRSKGGQLRIQGQYFERGGTLLRLPRFGNVSSGKIFNYELPKATNPLRVEPRRVQGPAYRRGQAESQVEPLMVQLKPFRPEKSLAQREVRANMFQEIGGSGIARERFVGHTRPLTQPEDQRESNIQRSQRTTLELLTGELVDPMQTRASKVAGASYSAAGDSFTRTAPRRSGIHRAGGGH